MSEMRMEKRTQPRLTQKERLTLDALLEAAREGLDFRRALDKRLAPMEALPASDGIARCR